MKIEVIFDPGCPWCYIGKRRLEQALALRPHVTPQIGWWPFLLNPDLPPEGLDRSTYLVRKFGSEARVGRVFGAIADAGQSVEIDFAFERIRRTPSTVDAHRLIRRAGEAGKGQAAVEALFYEHFVNGRNVGDIDVLVRVAKGLGLAAPATRRYLESDEDVALIQDENARAHRLGVNAVPTFVFNGEMVISGAQEPRVLARMLDVAAMSDVAP